MCCLRAAEDRPYSLTTDPTDPTEEVRRIKPFANEVTLRVLGHGYCAAVKESADLGSVVN